MRSAATEQGAPPPRSSWGRLLAAIERDRVIATAERLAAQLEVELAAPPESGLVLLTLRDGVAGTPFHLGEMPAARVAVRVRAADGRLGEGGAVVQGEDLERAWATALLDAVLAHGLPGAAAVAALLAEGAERVAATDRRRALLLARTKVDFTPFTAVEADEP